MKKSIPLCELYGLDKNAFGKFIEYKESIPTLLDALNFELEEHTAQSEFHSQKMIEIETEIIRLENLLV